MSRCCLVILVGVVIVTSLLTSCRTVEAVTDFDDLIDRLHQAGAVVEITSHTVRNLHLSVNGMVIVIGGENLQVFEYEDVAQAHLEFKALVGSSPGLVFFHEGEPPVTEIVPLNRGCYHSGRFVLLYDGENEAALKALRTAVGRPSAPR